MTQNFFKIKCFESTFIDNVNFGNAVLWIKWISFIQVQLLT